MRTCGILFGIAFSLCLAVTAPGLHSEGLSDEERIQQLLSEYVAGWREGDQERLANVFAKKGTVVWVSDQSGRQELESMTFEDVLNRQKLRPGYGQNWQLLSLDVVDGQLAVAKVDISRSGGSYVDVLVCQKIAEQWRIVHKSFVVR